MALHIKELFKEELELKRKQFLLSSESHYSHLKPSAAPWIIYSPKSIPELYKRETVPLNSNHSLDIIYKDDDFDHFIWKTSAANIKQAIYDGLISFDALTTKVISKLGKYINLTHRRAYHYGTISNKYDEKLFLLRLTQDRVAALQPLERLINNQNYANTSKQNLEALVGVLNRYLSELEKLKISIQQTDCKIEYYDRDAKQSLKGFVDDDIKRIKALKQRMQSLEAKSLDTFLSLFLRPYGANSIGCFIKEQAIRYMRQAQHINQNISYSRRSKSLMRGDFNSVCEDALLAIAKHKADLHNPVLSEHQGLFDDNQYAVDFSFLENDEDGINNTLMGITQIEGFDPITYGDNPSITNKLGEKAPLIQTRMTKWLVNESWQHNATRLIIWSINIFTGIFVGFTYDLFAGLIAFLSGQKLKSGAKKLHIAKSIKTCENTTYQALSKQIHAKTYSLGTLVGIRLRNFAINVFGDMTNGAKVTVNQVTFKFWESLKADYYLGHRNSTSTEETISSLTKELITLGEEKQRLTQQLKREIPAFGALPTHHPSSTYPEPSYHLNPGEWMDITNSAVNGIRLVFETFTDNIHAKHSTAGFIFTSAYIAGIGSILLPKLFSFLPKSYIAFSNAIGETMSKGTMAKAIGSGMTQAQLFTAAFEALANGHDSWLAQGSRMFEKEPADIITYITIAVGLGYLIAFELEIPGLSQMIREDLGNIPIPSLGFAGAKICILLVDFIKEKKARPINDKLPDIKQQLEQLLDGLFIDLDISQDCVRSNKENLIAMLLSVEFISQLNDILDKPKSNINSIDKQSLNKIRLLHSLESNKSLLPHLSTPLKSEIIACVKKMFPHDPDTQQTIYELLNPPPPQSIFVVTLTTIIDYIPLGIRCLAGLTITSTYEPFTEMKYKVRKDLTRLLNAASNALHGTASLVRVVCRNICDMVSNELVARADSFIYEDSHHISSSTYKMTEAFDTGFEHTHELLNKPIDNLKRLSTHSVAHSIFSKHTSEFFCNNKQNINNDVRSFCQIR